MQIAEACCLVVAGARGLGREIALGLAAAGADVAISFHSSATPAATVSSAIAALGVRSAKVEGDVRTAAGASALVGASADALDGLDAVVFAASGPFVPLAPHEIDEPTWDASLDTIAKGFFFVAVAAHQRFVAQGSGGVVVALTDVIGAERPNGSFAAHAAAKAAEAGLVKSLAKAWASDGVRVCGVAPGPVLLADDPYSERTARAGERTAFGQRGEPAEIAAAVCFCLENESLTGTNLVVDGGMSLR
jgi:NAD(P)-dependent dehydrogenase (short-subunit alcohol dehydrogenase family)